MSFELVTWYDTWNQTGYDNLAQGLVPVHLADRFNLAFAQLSPDADGYTIEFTGAYAAAVAEELKRQAPSALIYAGLGDTGLSAMVADNAANGNRSTANIVKYLVQNGLSGISIDAESDGMGSVVTFLQQAGDSFRSAGLGIAVSVPWPGNGPVGLYGDGAVDAFNRYVDAVELQDYSSMGTPEDAKVWTDAGVAADILLGGVATENGGAQTSIEDTKAWTRHALEHGLGGMFSWRLDNDHGKDGENEDVQPTFTGAQAIHDVVNSAQQARRTA